MRVVLVAMFVVLWCPLVFAQSPTGSIGGIVFDQDAKTIPGAEIIVVNDLTRVQYETKTNDLGIYAVPNLPPGPYRVQASKVGFKTLIKPDIVLNVQDSITINFTLPVGATSIAVTVEGGAPVINTQNAAVSTVVDRNFVENMPLNGRSFQDLILLTPGVVTNNPQSSSQLGVSGEFSVNGQRTESNYYAVDGVSANTGANLGTMYLTATSGSLPASTALGTTQALVSVDSLQEFRVQSSTYSAEFGRNPGGQFSFVTRSGTNQWQGSAFEYLRNDYFDANDWFNGYAHLPKASLRQNDFGATLGGAVRKDRTFFFFSYEGLRLLQPQPASVSYVPTPSLRQSTPSAVQSMLNAFPLPHCPAGDSNCTTDFGNGLGEYVGTWSNPSSIDAFAVRLDHILTQNEKLFFRYSDTPSSSGSRQGGNFESPSNFASTDFRSRSLTAGLSSVFSPRVTNSLRFNYSLNSSSTSVSLTDYGGAQPLDLAALQGVSPQARSAIQITLFLPGSAGFFPDLLQSSTKGVQEQWNAVDSASFSVGRHEIKLGMDYRRLNPTGVNFNPLVQYQFFSTGSLQSGTADSVFGETFKPARATFENFSAFAEDDWRITSRLVLSVGLRWDVNPAPSARKGELPYTTEGSSLATLVLAPEGTPLWDTGWHNFAPRLGIAYVLRDKTGFETVIRTGGGVFYDTGQQDGAAGYGGVGFSAVSDVSAVNFPAPLGQVAPAVVNPPTAPYGTVYSFPRRLQSPYTWQTNVSLQQALGKSQALTVTYVGGFARKLLQQRQERIEPVNPLFQDVFLIQNGPTSDYNALQVQFQRRLSQGLQVLASYTMSHCLDYGSQNYSLPYQRGSCDFDVRQNFSSALSYDLPNASKRRFTRALLSHWGLDDRLMARTGFPVTLNGSAFVDPATGQLQFVGLDLVPGQPTNVFGPQYPGGRAINVNAFANPSAGSIGDAPRNFARGFGAWQMDFALRREFAIGERVKLRFRAEAFNLFNHPSFGAMDSSFYPGSTTFGIATATLAQSLGILSPLYQIGGPRSLQFSLRLAF